MQLCLSALVKQTIAEEQRKLDEAMKTVMAQQCADDNDQASCLESTHATISLMMHSQKRILQLEERRDALKGQQLPACIDCGEPITMHRLIAVPEAIRCTSCQEEWEDWLQRCGQGLPTAMAEQIQLQK